MKMLGKGTLIYAGFTLACLAAGLVVVDLLSGTAHVHQGYYQAAASIIPLLLIAHMVRLNVMRDRIILGDRELFDELRGRQREAWSGLAEARAKAEASNAPQELFERIAQTEKLVRKTDAEIDRASSAKRQGELLQLLFGNFLITVILVAVGIGATLSALAKGTGTNATFLISGMAIGWGLFALVVFEVVLFAFFAPRALKSDRYGQPSAAPRVEG